MSQPELAGGNHVGYLWSSAVRRYLLESPASAGLEDRPVDSRT